MRMFRALMVVAALVVSVQAASAATRTWINLASPANGEWNYTNNQWNPGAVMFASGDTANFSGGSGIAAQNIFIGTAGVPQDITIAGMNIGGGYGTNYNFSGGDILGATASINMNQDNTGNFYRDASYSFGGGVNVNQAGTGGHIRYSPPSVTGPVQFGSGDITIRNTGSFYFQPGAAGAVLNNNFVVGPGGGGLSGNANAAFNGTVTMGPTSGTLTVTGRDIFAGLTFNITGNPVINIPSNFNSSNWSKFNGNINGGGVADVTIQTRTSGALTDYYSELSGAGGWNVKNVYFTGTSGHTIVPNSNTFFSGVAANGENDDVKQGMVVPSTGNNGNSTSKSGTYNVSVDHVVNAQLRAATINVNNGATVSGTGLLYTNMVNVNNGATIAPGLSAGILNVNGGISFFSGSTFDIEIGGLSVGTEYDRLAATGNATINSSLNVSLINGFEDLITSGDVFTILTANAVSGGFDNLINGRVELSGGLGSFLVTMNGNSVTLSDFQLPPAPEPHSFALLGLGLIGLAARKRKASRASSGISWRLRLKRDGPCSPVVAPTTGLTAC